MILLVAYFYPPCPDTGAHRAAAMAKYLRRLGHRVVVLTTSAYGSIEGEEDVVRTRDLQLLRARLGGHDRIQGMFESDTYSGHPHPLSKLFVPEPLVAAWAPFAMRAAKRLVASGALRTRRLFQLAVTGGTQLYEDARGTLTVTRTQSRPNRDRVVIKLIG